MSRYALAVSSCCRPTMVTMSAGDAAVSARTAVALVVVVTGNAVFGRRVPAGNARVLEDALRLVGDLRSVWRRG